MKKIVPLHSLVICVGPSKRKRDDIVKAAFPSYEVISDDGIRRELVGDPDRVDINSVVFNEINRRVLLKLALGERVVVNAANLRRNERTGLARLGVDCGVPVFYLLTGPGGSETKSNFIYQNELKDIQRGDGLAEVIDGSMHQAIPVEKTTLTYNQLREKWNGITVIGDVHGVHQSLLTALDWARSRNHFVVFLGDVIDYGPNSLEVADEVYRMVMRGTADILMGNHERKIIRWLDDRDVRLSEGNRVTTNALQTAGDKVRAKWVGRFRGLVAHTRLYRTVSNVVFTHAAVHPTFWNKDGSRKDIENYALFGEVDQKESDSEHLVRAYSWIDSIPQGKLVFVGHDIRSRTHPLSVRNSRGGMAVFLDTGSGKGGQLSSADLKFTENGLKLLNFNMF